jgi:hypothetical protein
MEELVVDSDAPTPPMGLKKSERLQLEDVIDDMKAMLETHIQSELAARTRLQLEFARTMRVIYLFGGISAASLLVQLVRIVAVLIIKGSNGI